MVVPGSPSLCGSSLGSPAGGRYVERNPNLLPGGAGMRAAFMYGRLAHVLIFSLILLVGVDVAAGSRG